LKEQDQIWALLVQQQQQQLMLPQDPPLLQAHLCA
jgi:hypothetical protein